MRHRTSGATKSVNRDLKAKARAVPGSNGYTAKLTTASPQFVVGAVVAVSHWIERGCLRAARCSASTRTVRLVDANVVGVIPERSTSSIRS